MSTNCRLVCQRLRCFRHFSRAQHAWHIWVSTIGSQHYRIELCVSWTREGYLCALCAFRASIVKSFKRIYQFVSSSNPFNALTQQTMTSIVNTRVEINIFEYFLLILSLDSTHSSYNTLYLSLFLRQNISTQAFAKGKQK